MDEGNAERCIDIKRLRLVDAVAGTRRGITDLAQAAIARQSAHVAGAKHVAHQHMGLVHIRLEEHTYELLSLMRISYAVFWLTNKINYRSQFIHVDIDLSSLP